MYLKEHASVANLRLGEYVEAEWPAFVLLFLFVPVKCADPELESNKLLACIPYFLIPLLDGVIIMWLVFECGRVAYKNSEFKGLPENSPLSERVVLRNYLR